MEQRQSVESSREDGSEETALHHRRRGAAATLGRGARELDLDSAGRELKRDGPLPAAVRRAVMSRDHARCRFPGCCRRRYVDVHHLTSRMDGGECSRSNCLVLCATHHRLLHDGKLEISGDAEGELTFSHPQSRVRFGTVSGATPGRSAFHRTR